MYRLCRKVQIVSEGTIHRQSTLVPILWIGSSPGTSPFKPFSCKGVTGNRSAIRSGTSSGVTLLNIPLLPAPISSAPRPVEMSVLSAVSEPCGLAVGVGGSRKCAIEDMAFGDLGLSSCDTMLSRFLRVCAVSGRTCVKPCDEATCSIDLKYCRSSLVVSIVTIIPFVTVKQSIRHDCKTSCGLPPSEDAISTGTSFGHPRSWHPAIDHKRHKPGCKGVGGDKVWEDGME